MYATSDVNNKYHGTFLLAISQRPDASQASQIQFRWSCIFHAHDVMVLSHSTVIMMVPWIAEIEIDC